MATEAKLRQLADKGCPVYYFYSTERYLVQQAVNAAVRILSADSDEDATVLDGAAPEIEGLIMAAGHEGDGIALAPITGQKVAEYLI